MFLKSKKRNHVWDLGKIEGHCTEHEKKVCADTFLQFTNDNIRYPDSFRWQRDLFDTLKLVWIPNQELICPDLKRAKDFSAKLKSSFIYKDIYFITLKNAFFLNLCNKKQKGSTKRLFTCLYQILVVMLWVFPSWRKENEFQHNF